MSEQQINIAKVIAESDKKIIVFAEKLARIDGILRMDIRETLNEYLVMVKETFHQPFYSFSLRVNTEAYDFYKIKSKHLELMATRQKVEDVQIPLKGDFIVDLVPFADSSMVTLKDLLIFHKMKNYILHGSSILQEVFLQHRELLQPGVEFLSLNTDDINSKRVESVVTTMVARKDGKVVVDTASIDECNLETAHFVCVRPA